MSAEIYSLGDESELFTLLSRCGTECLPITVMRRFLEGDEVEETERSVS